MRTREPREREREEKKRTMMEAAQVPSQMASPGLEKLERSAAVKMEKRLAILQDDEKENAGQAGAKRRHPLSRDSLRQRNGHEQDPSPQTDALPVPTAASQPDLLDSTNFLTMAATTPTEDIVQKMLEDLLSIPDKVFQSQCQNNIQNENLPPGLMCKPAKVPILSQSYTKNGPGISLELELGVSKQENMMLKAEIRDLELRENQQIFNAKCTKLEILELKEKMESKDQKIQELMAQLAGKDVVEKEMEKRLESERELEKELVENFKKSLESEAEAKKVLETKLQNVQKTLKTENSELKKSVATKEKRILKLENTQLELEKKTETLKKDFDEKSKSIAELEAKKSAYLEKLIRENNEKSKELAQVQQDLTKANKERKEVEDKLYQREKDYEILKNYFTKLQRSK